MTSTPSSEIIHLTSTFVDTLDSLPSTLARSLGDLRELDAVLSGSLQAITNKLQLLLDMMHSPSPDSPEAAQEGVKTYTPFERLLLLREVTEDARVFRLGGEDKIRVATGTCETLALATSHLATLSTLLLSFLPPTLLPILPGPSAPHGYPSSTTPASAIARRQMFDYPPAHHPGAGSTARMQGAMGMVREHWEATRGRTDRADRPAPKRKPAGASSSHAALDAMGEPIGGTAAASAAVGGSAKPPGARHPNQYTKKKIATPLPHYDSKTSVNPHPLGSNMTAVEAVRQKRREAEMASNAAAAVAAKSGMATPEEYAGAAGGPAPKKRRADDTNGAAKKRKRANEPSPEPGLPGQKPRRTKADSPEPMPVGEDGAYADYLGDEVGAAEEDEGDGNTYCFCDRPSFGEMIGCDANDCEREWFHLSCVGLSNIPKGSWFCADCRAKREKKKKR